MPPDAVLDIGHFATFPKTPRNTTPVPRPSHFGDVIHVDIVFGPEIAIGNVHYSLLFSDRFSCMTYSYPLKNLTSDIQKQIEYFFAHLGFRPRRIISDFDPKLIGGKARDYLNNLLIHVNAAPSGRQDRNGLAECHWQTMVAMARNWLTSAELPTKFWYFAVKCAAEICNYFHMKLESGDWSTPFELAHGSKSDLRVLFKLFSLAAVRRDRLGDHQLGKFDSQSVPMIAVGCCPNSNGLQFYNPVSGALVSSIDYKLQSNVTSGAHFGFRYQPGLFLYHLDESNTIFAPTFSLDSSVHVHTHSPPACAKVIGLPSYQSPQIYTVAFSDGSVAEYTADMLSLIPTTDTTTPSTLLPSWIKSGAKTTLFLSNMTQPKRGLLHFSEGDLTWQFFPGKHIGINGIPLHDLQANCRTLVDTGQLFRGHTKFKNVYDARNQGCSQRLCPSSHFLPRLLNST